MINTIKV